MLLGAGNTIQNTVSGNAGNLNSLESGLTGSLLPGLQQQIGDTRQQLNPAIGYANNVLGGQYLNSNPYTTGLAQKAGNDAANHVNATFSMAGRTGSNDHATQLARGVDQAENQALFQNYQNERGNQNTAAGMLPGLTGAQYAGYTPLLGATQLAGQLPYYGANALSGIGGLYNGYGTQTGTQPGGWLNGLLSAGASLGSAAIMASDRRLKTNIKLEFRAPDGLGWYSWNWRTNPNGEREHGVIADEVEKIRPQAFVKGFVSGVYDGVNYAVLGSFE